MKNYLQVFAEKNAGRRAYVSASNSMFDGYKITIVGWIRFLGLGDPLYQVVITLDNIPPSRSEPYTMTENFWLYRNDIKKHIFYLDVDQIKFIDDEPDDCLECGAKGKAPCQEWCKNR